MKFLLFVILIFFIINWISNRLKIKSKPKVTSKEQILEDIALQGMPKRNPRTPSERRNDLRNHLNK